MNPAKLARISALILLLFLSALPSFAEPPCSCNYCQRFPDRACDFAGTPATCLEFLALADCLPLPPAISAEAPSSKEAFLASLSGQPTQQLAGCLSSAS